MEKSLQNNLFVVFFFISCIGFGLLFGWILFHEDSDYNRKFKENYEKVDSLYNVSKNTLKQEMNRSDSLKKELDTARSVILDLKKHRDEKINGIDSMDTHDLYLFFSDR